MEWIDWSKPASASRDQIEFFTAVSIAAEAATAVAAIVAVFVAILGLRTWWKQLKGTTEYRLTHDLLRQTFKFRDTIKAIRRGKGVHSHVRRMFSTCAGETIDDVIWDEEQFEIHSKWVEKMLAQTENTLHSIQGLVVEAEVIWGRNIRDAFEPLIAQYVDFQSVLRLHQEVVSPTTSEDSREFAALLYQGRNGDAILYSRVEGDDPDEFDSQLEANIDRVTAVVRRYMRP